MAQGRMFSCEVQVFLCFQFVLKRVVGESVARENCSIVIYVKVNYELLK
jgi:hypothetical protein